MSQVEEWEKSGMKDLPKKEVAIVCQDLIVELNNFILQRYLVERVVQTTPGIGAGFSGKTITTDRRTEFVPSQHQVGTSTIFTPPATTFGRSFDRVTFQTPLTRPTTSFERPHMSYPIGLSSNEGDFDGQYDQRIRKVFNMKWADKVPKFDGTFEKFHSFIAMFDQFVHYTDADEPGKLLLLRE
ncbi:hypothetical protein BLA29_010591, partial [Euroglyphus maynei]